MSVLKLNIKFLIYHPTSAYWTFAGQVPAHVIPPWLESDPEPGPPAPTRKIITGWNLLAQVVDRIAFLLYFFIILIFMATYIGKSTANLS